MLVKTDRRGEPEECLKNKQAKLKNQQAKLKNQQAKLKNQ